jgi:predicted dehydrogenase
VSRAKRLRCCVIGAGRIGSKLEEDRLREKPASHSGAFARNRECQLVAAADSSQEALSAWVSRWGQDKRVYLSAAEMLERERPDIVSIATHPDSHAEYLLMAARAGVPVVICEKPLAADLAAGQRLRDEFSRLVAAGSPTKAVVNHERRFARNYGRAREIVRAGKEGGGPYGKLLSLSARLFMGKARDARAVLIHDGTHLFDAARFLSGYELKRVSAQTLGDTYYFCGTLGQAGFCLECGPGRDYLEFELDLSFERGRLSVGNGVYEEWESRESPYYEGFRSLAPVRAPGFRRTGYFANMTAHAADLARGRAEKSQSSVEDGLAALEAAEGFCGLLK